VVFVGTSSQASAEGSRLADEWEKRTGGWVMRLTLERRGKEKPEAGERRTTAEMQFTAMTCLLCSAALAPVVEHAGRTALQIALPGGGVALVDRAEVQCRCGGARRFYGEPLVAIRLGLADGG
jgi:hypothetical protein